MHARGKAMKPAANHPWNRMSVHAMQVRDSGQQALHDAHDRRPPDHRTAFWRHCSLCPTRIRSDNASGFCKAHRWTKRV